MIITMMKETMIKKTRMKNEDEKNEDEKNDNDLSNNKNKTCKATEYKMPSILTDGECTCTNESYRVDLNSGLSALNVVKL